MTGTPSNPRDTSPPPGPQEGGGQERQLTAGPAVHLVKWIAVFMSVFQLYTGFFGELSGAKQLSIHLSFAMLLCYLNYPLVRKTSQSKIPVYDFALALLAAAASFYVYVNYEHVAYSVGNPALYDLIIGGALIVFILEATRRSISPILPVLTLIFLFYAYIGPHIPGTLAHRGFGISRIIDHVFMSGEGLWGVPLRVSATFVFLFVLFGAFLEKMGAGDYLIDLSFASMGRFRGGPAKAAVVASGAMGSISGSSIANTVTTGSMTIPLMKKVGFKPHTAAAVEVAASTNGQLMPPIMGAAAFIMAELLGISYYEVVTAAIIPALLSYTAIFSIVHLEAVKENIRGLTKEETPALGKTFVSGLYYLIPLAALLYFLLIEFWTPTTSATWSILVALPVIAGNNIFRHFAAFPKRKGIRQETRDLAYEAYTHKQKNFFIYRTKDEILGALESGARNMAGIAAACACCGIIIGVITLTGLGLKMAMLISAAAGNSLFLSLIFAMFACIILGMGLPTTATYIIMAAMTAPAISTISQNLGAELPLIAIHLFVFYYGIVADDTPPVGLCAYAASGISGSDPVVTGFKSFRLDLAAFTLPFMFIYNPKLLMINTSAAELTYIIPMCILGMFCWSVFIQGFWLVRTYLWERFIYVILAFFLVNPSGVTLFGVHLPHLAVNTASITIMVVLFFWHRQRRERETAGSGQ
ncbi:TRAP transporter permease [Desulfovermiculus halophilus]|uniref:TRAP transporter permease n=1 Tax=Desulfovermiculus halophilus TaxID=339722 RepID=UPI000A00ACC4|nr:TRAP transporter permease [Desulfovermiculus halophilus]